MSASGPAPDRGAEDPSRGGEPGPVALDYPFGALEPNAPRLLEEGVWLLPIAVPFPPGSVTCVAIAEPDGPFAGGWTLIDVGLADAATRETWRGLLGGPLAGRPVRRVIATHHHPDHIGLAGWFQTAHGAELWTSRTAWLFARMLQLDAWDAPPAEAEAHHRASGYDAEMLARWRTRAKRNFSVTVAPMPLGVRVVAEGARLRIGGRSWRVLFSHGHAPDHLVLLREGAGGAPDLALAGDAVLPRITPNIGVYATEPEADPLGDWMAACARLAIHLDDAILVIPGHGDPFRGARRRLRLVLAKHDRALDRLEARLSAPRTVVECFEALYRREITPALEGLATNETRAHLNRLVAEGRARRETRADGVLLWRAAG